MLNFAAATVPTVVVGASPVVLAAVLAAGASDGRPGEKRRARRRTERKAARASRFRDGGPGRSSRGFFRGALLRWSVDGCAVRCGRGARRRFAQALPAVPLVGIAGVDSLRILARLWQCAKPAGSGMPYSCGALGAGRALVGRGRLGSGGIPVQRINDEMQVKSFLDRVDVRVPRLSTSGPRPTTHGVGITGAGAPSGVQCRQRDGARRDVGFTP